MIRRLILTALVLAVFATQAMAYGSITVETPSMGLTLPVGPPPPPPVYIAPPPPPGYVAYPLPPGQSRKYWRRHGYYPPPPPPGYYRHHRHDRYYDYDRHHRHW